MPTMQTKERNKDGIAYANKEPYEYQGEKYLADLQNGGKVTIKSEGVWEESNFGNDEQFKVIVETPNGDKKATFNQSSINVLIKAFGEESPDWIGKEVKVLTRKGVFAGRKGIACYFVTDDYFLDDYGDLTNGEENEPSKGGDDEVGF